MDDPNNTIEEYIRLEEEKARKHGKVYNWKTAMYGKIWYDEDAYDPRSIETEFPVIVYNDVFTSEVTPSCEPMISPLNDNKIDFRISFDESDDEDYMLEVSYSNDLDFFKDFENEFPAIVYNDALTSKSDFLTEPTIRPKHVDEFNLKDETSLSECDEKEQNVLYFNDIFPFNDVHRILLHSFHKASEKLRTMQIEGKYVAPKEIWRSSAKTSQENVFDQFPIRRILSVLAIHRIQEDTIPKIQYNQKTLQQILAYPKNGYGVVPEEYGVS
ncbi:hypothetical protein Tco_1229414 [Tanacetum coccineum]